MYSDRIISLCYVSKQSDKTKELCRIADFHNNGFESYVYDSTYDFYETERDLIYGARKDIAGEVGSISVYEWSAYRDNNNEWRTMTHDSDVPWIEVVSLFKDTPEQIIDLIKAGIKIAMPNTRKHDFIFCCSAKGAYSDAIYIAANDLVCVNDRYTFAEHVVSLETAQINYYEDTASCRCRYNPSDTIRYYVRPSSWKATGKVIVRSYQEIVQASVIAYARRLDKEGVISRKERQSFTSVIEKLSISTITDEVMEKLGYDRDDAEYCVKECLENLSNRMNRNEADWVMRQLIENNSEYEEEMYRKVEELWHQVHTSARAEFSAELKQHQETLATVQQEITIARKELADAKAHKEQCEADATEALQLQEDIEKNIQDRLASIRGDRAKALVDEAWTMAFLPSTPTSASHNSCTLSFVYDGNTNPIEEVSLQERWMDAISSWEHICGNEKRGFELTAFFLAAYSLKQHLIISGECAELLADMTSKLITGRDCTKIYVADFASVTEVINELTAVPHDCICFINGLEQNQNVVKAVMQHFGESHFIITAPYYESLVMEPASLFTTFLPVCSEEFCINTTMMDVDNLSCKEDLSRLQRTIDTRKLRSIRVQQSSWFANGFFSPLLIERCARIQHIIKTLLASPVSDGEKESKAAMLSLVFVPLMRCLRRKDILTNHVDEFDVLDETRRNRLLAFAGIEKE